MIVMPSNCSGWFWHTLAHETGALGHLYSPGAQRGPWPWFPYALDNGCYSCWTEKTNAFDNEKWNRTEQAWKNLLFWAQSNCQGATWAIVPDRPGSAQETFQKWSLYAGIVEQSGFPLALAVQDGMTPDDVRALSPAPTVICVGGTTEWKWATVEQWASDFQRVHLLRCNAPSKLSYLERLGVESCDGTGWNFGDAKQTRGLEEFCRRLMGRHRFPLWPYVCRGERKAARQLKGQPTQEVFA